MRREGVVVPIDRFRHFCYGCPIQGRALHNGRRLATLPKGGETMRFTFTFHVGGKTITLSLVVKSKNRHPGR